MVTMILPFKTLLLSFLFTSLATAQNICPASETLENGFVLSANLITPTGKRRNIYSVKKGGTIDVDIKATASAGLGMGGNAASLHFTYVVDISSSTNDPCGGENSGDTVLDCEKNAVLALHDTIKASGAAADFGVVSFDDQGTSATFADGRFVTTDLGAQDGSVEDAVNALTIGGDTDFSAALEVALNSITESAAQGEKRIIFLSDGEDLGDAGDFENALQPLIDAGVIINSFAIGAGHSCQGDRGELQRMADETGGECRNVADAADLENELLKLLALEITSADITLNGKYLTRIEGPFEGPVSMTIDSTATFLPEGDYEACIEVTGSDRQNGQDSSATIRCCAWFHVKSAPDHYDPFYHSYKTGRKGKTMKQHWSRSSKGKSSKGHRD